MRSVREVRSGMREVTFSLIRGIRITGQYEQVSADEWRLVAWRIDANTGHGWSDWYKVRSNKRKDIGVLKLRLETAQLAI